VTKSAVIASRRNEILTAGLAAFIYAIPLHISKPLLFGVTDLRNFVINVVRSRDAGAFVIGASGDVTRSLGISNYPIALFLDIPWLLTTSVPPHLSQVMFGVTTCISLYAAVNVLGHLGKVAAPARRIAGFALPILMFLPGPVEWNVFTRYTASFGWTVATLTIALAIFLRRSHTFGWKSSIQTFVLGCLIFWANMSYLPMTLPPSLLAICFGWIELRRSIGLGRYLRHAASLLVPAILMLPLFIGIYLFGVWAIPEVAVQENIDQFTSWSDLGSLLLPFPALSASPLSIFFINGYWLRAATTIFLIVSIWIGNRQKKSRLSRLGTWSLISLSVYTIVYYLVARFANREIGLDPKYVEIVAYPIWILLIADMFSVTKTSTSRVSRRVAAMLPIVVMLLWGTQWTIRNTDIRFQPPEYPVRLSNTSLQLEELVAADQEGGTFSRVIIVQERQSVERAGEGSRIRRSTGFTETFHLELSYLKVPILNAYSHLISPRTFARTNERFGDGRPSWRQFSLYDQVDIPELVPFGIKYVLSEVSITDPDLELLSADQYLAYGLFPTKRPAYLYRVTLPDSLRNPNVHYSLSGRGLRVKGKVGQPTSLTIPVEYSRCLTIEGESATSVGTLTKNSNHLVQLTVKGSFDFEIVYLNSLFQLKNCRIVDYLDFRKEQGL